MSGVVVPESGGTPFRQIFLSRNGAPVNILSQPERVLRRSGKSSRTIKKLAYTRNLANWFSGK